MIRTISKLRYLLSAFEAGSLQPHEWNHRTRLILGLWNVLNPSPCGSVAAMRAGIVACEARLEGSRAHFRGYSETITALYLERIQAFAVAAPANMGLLDLTNALLASKLAVPQTFAIAESLSERRVKLHQSRFPLAAKGMRSSGVPQLVR